MLLAMLMAQSWPQLLFPSLGFAILYLAGGLAWLGHWIKSSQNFRRIAQQFPRPEQNPDRSGIAIMEDWPDGHQQPALHAPNNSIVAFATSARSAVLGEQQQTAASVTATREFLERVAEEYASPQFVTARREPANTATIGRQSPFVPGSRSQLNVSTGRHPSATGSSRTVFFTLRQPATLSDRGVAAGLQQYRDQQMASFETAEQSMSALPGTVSRYTSAQALGTSHFTGHRDNAGSVVHPTTQSTSDTLGLSQPSSFLRVHPSTLTLSQPWRLLTPHIWTLGTVYLGLKVTFMCSYAAIIGYFHLVSPPTFRTWQDTLLVATSVTAGFVSGVGMSLVCGICLGWCAIRQSIRDRERHLMYSALGLGLLTSMLSHLMSSYAPLFSLAAPIILQRFLGPTLQQTFSSLTALISPTTGMLQLPRIMHPRSLAVIHTKLRWVDSIRRGVSVWVLSLGIRELLALTIQTSSVRSGSSRDGLALDASAWTIFLIHEIPDLALCVLLLWNLRLREPVPWFGVGNGLLTVRAADLGRRNQPSQIPLTEMPPMDSLDALHQQAHSPATKWALGIATRHAKHTPAAYAVAYLPAHYHRPHSGLRLTLHRQPRDGGDLDVAEMLAVREDVADREREGKRLAFMFREAMAAATAAPADKVR